MGAGCDSDDVESIDVLSESAQVRVIVPASEGDTWVALPNDAIDGTLAVETLALRHRGPCDWRGSHHQQAASVPRAWPAPFVAFRSPAGAAAGSPVGRMAVVAARDGTLFRGVVVAASSLPPSGPDGKPWVVLAMPAPDGGRTVRLADYAWMSDRMPAECQTPRRYAPACAPPSEAPHTEVLLEGGGGGDLRLVSYMRLGITWRASYVIALRSDESRISSVALHGVVTNATGHQTCPARVRLLASGAAQPLASTEHAVVAAPRALAAASTAGVDRGRPFEGAGAPPAGEAVVYFDARGVSLPPGDTVVSAGTASDLSVRQWAAGWRTYFVDASAAGPPGPVGTPRPALGVAPRVGYRFATSRFVPAGEATLYDQSAGYAFVGSAALPATPAGQPIDLATGHATDVLADVSRVDVPDPRHEGNAASAVNHGMGPVGMGNAGGEEEAKRWRLVRIGLTLRFSSDARAIDRVFLVSYDIGGHVFVRAAPRPITVTATTVEWSVPVTAGTFREAKVAVVGRGADNQTAPVSGEEGGPVMSFVFDLGLYRSW